MDTFRELMIEAYNLGMTNGDYVFIMCTRYNGDFFGNYNWHRGDEFDQVFIHFELQSYLTRIVRFPIEGRWFFPGTRASSTTKNPGRHKIA